MAIAKPRVHEIAKELGIPSKDLITKLNELGEYVKGPSSTLEAPVVRKAREAFPEQARSRPRARAKAPSAPKPAAPKPIAPAAPSEPDAVAAQSAPSADASAPPATPAAPGAPTDAANDMPRPRPRPGGNNPFSDRRDRAASASGWQQPIPGAACPRRASRWRPRGRASPRHRCPAPGWHGRPASRRICAASRWSPSSQVAAALPVVPAQRHPVAVPQQAVAAAAAAPQARSVARVASPHARASRKRAKRQEYEQQQAPAIGGVQIPRGDGATPIRLRRGATLSRLRRED